MHNDTEIFLKAEFTEPRVRDLRCLEVGSLNEFTVRNLCDKFRCKEYVGLDMQPGPGVDIVCDVTEISFNGEFDIIVCCNTLEHIEFWREAITRMKRALKGGGLIYISVPSSDGRRVDTYHGYPSDYWRFSGRNLLDIFSEYNLLHYTHTDHALSTENLLCAKADDSPSIDYWSNNLHEIEPMAVVAPPEVRPKGRPKESLG